LCVLVGVLDTWIIGMYVGWSTGYISYRYVCWLEYWIHGLELCVLVGVLDTALAYWVKGKPGLGDTFVSGLREICYAYGLCWLDSCYQSRLCVSWYS
jgi:hypothetical protein